MRGRAPVSQANCASSTIHGLVRMDLSSAAASRGALAAARSHARQPTFSRQSSIVTPRRARQAGLLAGSGHLPLESRSRTPGTPAALVPDRRMKLNRLVSADGIHGGSRADS